MTRHAVNVLSTVLVPAALVAALATLAVPSAGAQNLVSNGTFDHDVVGWESVGPTVVPLHRPGEGSDLAGGSGPGCLEVRHFFWNGGLGGPREHVEPVTAGASYLLEASYRLPSDDNVADSVAVFLDWTDENGFVIRGDSIEAYPLVRDGWARLSGRFTAPVDSRGVWVWVMVGNPVLADETRPGIAWFDDVWFSVEGVDTATQALFVPAAASASGVGGTFWSTTGWVASLVDVPVTVSAAFLSSGGDNSAAVGAPVELGVIPPRGFLELGDMVGTLGAVDESGGIYLLATAEAGGLPSELISATTHTFTPNTAGPGGYGQGLPAVPAGERSRVVVPGIYQGVRFRTNVGVLNTSAEPITVELTIRDAGGAEAATAAWNLAPYEHRQRSLPSLGLGALDGGTLTVNRTAGGGPFRAYTSTVDQDTGDAVYNAGR